MVSVVCKLDEDHHREENEARLEGPRPHYRRHQNNGYFDGDATIESRGGARAERNG
ncbi:hypothetical protein MSG28_009347 [Choristoneura fumiferana]|uniref:Uncharacterized protein n=1 Tax=Choristoneura fumiferana TaxID=7141 RepID=A0ACC0KXN5_CHOFU|nr:hypothetical protein MSG28_009347 [Choristoneura fumiferana]